MRFCVVQGLHGALLHVVWIAAGWFLGDDDVCTGPREAQPALGFAGNIYNMIRVHPTSSGAWRCKARLTPGQEGLFLAAILPPDTVPGDLVEAGA